MTKTRYIPLPGAGGGEVVLQGLQATQNITYRPGPGVTGFNQVDVNVPASEVDQGTKQDTISQNGTQTIDVVGYAGHEITVDVPNGVQGLQVTQNGTYRPTSPNIGFDVVDVNVQFPDEPKYLYIENVDQNDLQTLVVFGNNGSDYTNFTLYTSTDKINWTRMTQGITIPVNGKVYFYGENANPFNQKTLSITGGDVNIGGDVTTLMTKTGNQVQLPEREFDSLFKGSTAIIDASHIEIPSAIVGSYALSSMFANCSSLVTPPSILPAIKLNQACYQYMFSGCTSLTTAPSLPATTIAINCYQQMFQHCTSLVSAPALPALRASSNCYASMFKNCTSLTAAPALPATEVLGGSYSSMFEGCTSLVTAPVLNATSLSGDGSYNSMFKGCTALVSAPALPATTAPRYCYANMFLGCTSLVNAPSLPATTLNESCYSHMFEGCTSLVTAPTLSVTTLVRACYDRMFLNCSSLSSIVCLAEDISAPACTTNWVSGVAASGTFTKSANMSTWPTGDSGIPSGWTVQDYVA